MMLPMLLQGDAVLKAAQATAAGYGQLGAGIGIGLAIRAAGILFAALLEGTTIIALVFGLLFKLM